MDWHFFIPILDAKVAAIYSYFPKIKTGHGLRRWLLKSAVHHVIMVVNRWSHCFVSFEILAHRVFCTHTHLSIAYTVNQYQACETIRPIRLYHGIECWYNSTSFFYARHYSPNNYNQFLASTSLYQYPFYTCHFQ